MTNLQSISAGGNNNNNNNNIMVTSNLHLSSGVGITEHFPIKDIPVRFSHYKNVVQTGNNTKQESPYILGKFNFRPIL